LSEVLFYHLSDSTLETVLPPLLEKSLERGWRAVVQFASEERRDALNGSLWTVRDDSFIGHGLDSDPHAALQPVILTLNESNPNGASIRFLVDGARPGAIAEYQRIVLIFDGHDMQQVEAARGHWRGLREAGHTVTYWRQTPEGGWQRQA
jgi:DNA polymerase-3 subunit chi